MRSKIWLGTLGIFVCLLAVNACTPSFDIEKPPAAQVGDGLLSVTVQTRSHLIIPARSRIVITISDTSRADISGIPLAGDETVLRRADKSLRLAFPVDQAALAPCADEGRCSLSVHIIKDGVLRFINDTMIPFRAGQTRARVEVTQVN